MSAVCSCLCSHLLGAASPVLGSPVPPVSFTLNTALVPARHPWEADVLCSPATAVLLNAENKAGLKPSQPLFCSRLSLDRVCRKSQGAAVEASRSFAAEFSGAAITLLPADPFPYVTRMRLSP